MRVHQNLRVKFLLPFLILTSLLVTAFAPLPPPLMTAPQQGDSLQVFQSGDGLVSVRLPADWQIVDQIAEGGFLIYGNSDAAVTGRLNDYNGQPALLAGEGGSITVVELSQYGLTEATPDVLQTVNDSVMAELMNNNGVILEETVEASFGPGMPALVTVIQAANEQGFVVVAGYEGFVALITATGTRQSFEENRDLLQEIAFSIRVPAESGTVASDTVDEDSAANLVRSSEGQVSLILPEGWVYEDQLADNNVLAYGDTETGMQSRLDVVLADDPSTVVVSNNGGVIQLFSNEELDIDPANPDLAPLMNQLANVFNQQGNTIIQEATPFTIGDEIPGLYMIVDTVAQYGYVALIGFPDAVVFMTATGKSDTFEDVQGLLFSVVESVRVPAQEAGTDDTSSGGAGAFPGLGGGTPGVALPQTASTPDGSFSVSLPIDWAVLVDTNQTDYKAVIYYGENEEAIDIFRADLNPDVPSGIIFLWDATAFAPDAELNNLFEASAPESLDLTKTLTADINGSQARWGTYVLSPGTDNAYEAYYVVIHLANGDWALVVSGTAPENFEDAAPLLEAIFKSIEVGGSSSGLGSGSSGQSAGGGSK